MRKVTQQIVSAFLLSRTATVGNSSTDGTSLFLHGNEIARHGVKEGVRGVFITLADWNTTTTKERLWGVLSLMSWDSRMSEPVVSIFTRDFQTYVGRVDRPCKEAHELSGRDWLFVAATSSGLVVQAVIGEVVA